LERDYNDLGKVEYTFPIAVTLDVPGLEGARTLESRKLTLGGIFYVEGKATNKQQGIFHND
jgi:hypothetical protein